MIVANINNSLIVAENTQNYLFETPQKKYIAVLVDRSWVKDLLSYEIPNDLVIKPGDILTVPFGDEQLGAIAVKFIDQIPADLEANQIRKVIDVVQSGFFSEDYWQLLTKIADYYFTPLMQVIKVALPPGLLSKSQTRIKLIAEENGEFKYKFQRYKWEQDGLLSFTAKQILQLLLKQNDGDYSRRFLVGKVKNFQRGFRELQNRKWVESYLHTPKNQSEKLQKAVTFIGDDLDDNLTEKQREVLITLKRQGGDLWLTDLVDLCKLGSNSVVETLAKKGFVTIESREKLRLLVEPPVKRDQNKDLTVEQKTALDTINNLSEFAEVLLHGITGSGKTEVYLQAIAPILAQEKSVLVLVPEIGLTPQLTDRFKARFGDKVFVYHSALSDGERYDTWRQMLSGDSQVVIGTRSAIFAPLPDLGLIILDEEHDHSFKQDQPMPNYHARTVAKWRSQLVNCTLILGSATPSLESYTSIKKNSENSDNKYYLSLPTRVYDRPLPPVQIVDMRNELKAGNRTMFSRDLRLALEQLQRDKKQGILFVHRRGHSTFVSCRSCGFVIECPNCDVSLSYHFLGTEQSKFLQCHYCNFQRSHPDKCPDCDSPYLKFFGSGTQKVEEELKKYFPELKIIRFDSDTTTKKYSHRDLLTKFAKGEADILLGTQMLTKGLDLPQVTLVGIVVADGLLYLSDYRAAERAFQTFTQVAGRSGRGEDPGRVIVQTYTPDHPVVLALEHHDYQRFSQEELAQRLELNYPPYGRLILLKLSSIEPEQVERSAEKIAEFLEQETEESRGYELLGPAPASILRVNNRYRWQIMLKFPSDQLPKIPDWEKVRSLCHFSVNLTIDVDPLNMW
jgi:primosomal protein N' (replication factor Y) (superfamily II helicase)